MRNLKRALSLALASVMLLSMMVVGSGAAIADVDADKHNVEALEVLKLVKAMVGDGTNINPDQKVTRHEAAVVVSNLLGVDKKSYKAHPFTDVASWADTSVAVCYAEGITGGISATEFGGNNTITTLQAGLFVLKALGYFQYASDFAADGWEKATTKAAAKIKLFDGVEAKAYEGLTRNDFATIVFNALKSYIVEPDAGRLGVDANGNLATIYSYNATEETLMAKLFGEDLKDEGVAPNAITGIPEQTWTYGEGEDAESVSIPAEADYAFSVEEDVDDLIAYMVEEEIVDEDEITCAIDYEDILAGADVEVFVDSDDAVEYVVVKNYTLYVVGETEELDEDEIEDLEETANEAAKATIEILNTDESVAFTVYDINFKGDFEEGDYILACVFDGEDYDVVLAAKAAKLVEGEIDATKGGELRIGKTFYANACGAEVGDKGVWALNAAGALAAVVEEDENTEKSDDYAYIYRIVKTAGDEGKVGTDGIVGDDGDATYTAYVVLADGTKASYELALDEDGFIEGTEEDPAELFEGEATIADVAALVAYELIDGKFAIAAEADTVEAGSIDAELSKVAYGEDKTAYTNAKTEFVFINVVDEDIEEDGEVVTKKGVYVDVVATKDVIMDAGEIQFIAKDGKVLTVFVVGENGEEEEEVKIEKTYAVMLDREYITTGTGKDTVYTFSIWVDGKETELKVDNTDDRDEIAAISDDTWFVYYTEDGAIKADEIFGEELAEVDVVVEGEYVYIDGVKYELDALTLYTETISKKGEFSFATGAKLAAEDAVKVYATEYDEDDADKAIAWIVVEVIDNREAE